MPMIITADNIYFYDPKQEVPEEQISASGSALCRDLPGSIADYVRASLSANTRKAYVSDLAQFEAWGGSIPSSPETVAAYLSARANVLHPGTLARHLVAIGKAHQAKGHTSPTSSTLVKAVLRGIKRAHGTRQDGAKPLLRDDLFLVLDRLTIRPKDLRDRAVLLLGFAGGFRRSELVGLDVEDLERVRQGLIVTLRRSKTDQTGLGRKVGIPFGRTKYCPVKAVEAWLEHSRICAGAIFRPIAKSGVVQSTRLSTDGLCRMLQARVSEAGFRSAGYSGHSLRSGFATSAAQAGVASWKIRQQTGHASDAMLLRYIRAGEMFLDNAACLLL